jgi:hypothetical protein
MFIRYFASWPNFFCFHQVTVTTVGYGDYSALNCATVEGTKTGHKIFIIFFILFGLGTVASIIASTCAYVSTYMSKERNSLDLASDESDSLFDRQPRKGDQVMLSGYRQRAEMNGLTGMVLAELDEGYEVRIDSTGEDVSIRAEHLEILFVGAAR